MADLSRKRIITCAITGSIHTPTMSDALPYAAEDSAREAVEAAEAGALGARWNVSIEIMGQLCGWTYAAARGGLIG